MDYIDYHTQKMQDDGLTDVRSVSELQKNIYEVYHEQIEKENLKKKEGPINYGDVGWGKVILKSISDLPGSIPGGLANDIKGIKDFFSSPIQNAKALANLYAEEGLAIQGRMENAGIPKLGEKSPDVKNLKAAMLFENEMYNLFGTEESFKRTIAEKPYEVFSTIASMVLPATKAAGLEKVAKIASYAEPVNLLTLAAKTPLTGIMQIPKIRELPVNLASRTLKLLADMPEARRVGLVNTFLDNRSVATFSEVEKITGQMDELNKIINKAISEQDFAAIWFDPSKRMEVDKIYKGLDELRKKTLENSSYGTDASNAIDHVKEALQKADTTELKRTDMIPSEVQSRKVKFNKELSEAYQKSIQALEDTPIKNEAKMVINRNMRSFLETVIPDIDVINETKLTNKLIQERFPGAKSLNIKELNRLEGDLAEIRHAIQDTANKSRFGNLASWQLVTKMGAFSGMGYAAGSLIGATDPAAWAKIGGAIGASLGAFDSSPYLKSKVAVYLKDLQTLGLSNAWNNPNAAMIRMGLYDMNRISSTQEDADKQ